MLPPKGSHLPRGEVVFDSRDVVLLPGFSDVRGVVSFGFWWMREVGEER